MGTLIGHVGPGFGFILIGLWHLYNNLKLLALKGPSSFKSRPWFPAGNRGQPLRQLELYMIITGSALSVAMELFIGPEKHQPLDSDWTIPSNHLHNFEHSLISLTFLIYALFALLLDKWRRRVRVTTAIHALLHEVLYLMAALAFAQQLLLFHLHSTDHVGVEGQYHGLLQLVISVSLGTTLLAIWPSAAKSFPISFLRSLSIVFQGTWLVVMGYALWTPSLIAKGCFIHVEEGHEVVRCDSEESLHRAKALVNIQFSGLLIVLAVFGVVFYMFMMVVYGNGSDRYSVMSSSLAEEEEEEEMDVEAQKRNNNNFVETQSLVNGNKVIDHMER